MAELHDWERVLAASLPKIELHLHLDGSLSTDFIARRAQARGIELPCESSKLRQWLHDQKIANLEKNVHGKLDASRGSKNWPVFDFCNQFLQTKEELEEATEDILDRLIMPPNNVVYGEIRFCPQLHTLEGLSLDEVVQAVIEGFRKKSSASGIQGGVIICALRSLSARHGTEMAELAAKYLQRQPGDPIGVVGYDVAGDEGTFSLQSKEDSMFEGVMRAKKLGVPVTVHAGEWPERYGTVENVRFAFKELNVRRIGHGIALRSDQQLLNEIQRTKTTIEVCLTSNCGQSFKVPSYDAHPVKLFFDSDLSFTLSSDNLLLGGNKDLEPSPFNEVIALATKVMEVTKEEPLRGWKSVEFSLKSGIRAAFSPTIDREWIQNFDKNVDAIFKKYLKSQT